MRVISQDGTIDVPYEMSSLSMVVGKYEDVVNAAIYCHNSFSTIRIAEYSSEEKAKKAMEMLRERHVDNIFCREDIQYKAEMLLDDGLQIVREMMIKCEYFQFPTEEELE